MPATRRGFFPTMLDLYTAATMYGRRAALAAAEGVIGNRHRDRHVDADHADIDLGGEIARGVAVAGSRARIVSGGIW